MCNCENCPFCEKNKKDCSDKYIHLSFAEAFNNDDCDNCDRDPVVCYMLDICFNDKNN